MIPTEQQLKEELIALGYAVSHDLRAPLRAIEGFGQILAEDFGKDLSEEAAGHIEHIRSAAARMNKMIDGLLELSRVARAEMHRSRVDITAMVNSITTDLRGSDPSRDVTFSVDHWLAIDGDAALLEVAFRHLLRNAWKFTSRHSSARIHVGREPARPRRIFVRDDGAGFDPAYADKMFAPLQRMHSLSEFDGVGIGLAVVQRIIRRHGGDVSAEGRIENGATIFIDLP